jgi:hypothetical protein
MTSHTIASYWKAAYGRIIDPSLIQGVKKMLPFLNQEETQTMVASEGLDSDSWRIADSLVLSLDNAYKTGAANELFGRGGHRYAPCAARRFRAGPLSIRLLAR